MICQTNQKNDEVLIKMKNNLSSHVHQDHVHQDQLSRSIYLFS